MLSLFSGKCLEGLCAKYSKLTLNFASSRKLAPISVCKGLRILYDESGNLFVYEYFCKKKKRYGRVAFTTSAKTSLFKELEIL